MLYRIVVYLHVLGAMGWFLTTGVEAVVLARLARASTAPEQRDALASLRPTRILGPITALLVLVPGIYMASTVWTGHPPWVGLGYLSFIIVFVVGAAITGRRMTRLEKALGAANADLTRAVEVPLTPLRAAFYVRVGVLLAVTFVMVVKPEAAVGFVALTLGIALGLVAAFAKRRPSSGAPADRSLAV
jgi:hypothetical protein